METLFNIITLFLVINAIFWSLFCHKSHCKVAKIFGMSDDNCPAHWIHILFGIICFFIAIGIKQREYIRKLLSK